jgi:hypothetical protein
MMSRRRRQQKADTKGKIILGITVILTIVFIYAGVYLYEPPIKRDDKTACRLDGYVSEETVVVIDATDDFNETQALRVKKEISNMLSDSVLDERFSLYVIDEKAGLENKKFTVCNPGDGAGKSELTYNKRRLKKQGESKFYDRFANSVDELIGNNTASQSPILEMIKLVSINTFLDSKAQSKRLVIVSDMLHHTSELSHYKKNIDYDSFQKTPYAAKMQSILDDVEVSILYILRPSNLNVQNRGHIEFWNRHVQSSNGFVSTVKTVN